MAPVHPPSAPTRGQRRDAARAERRAREEAERRAAQRSSAWRQLGATALAAAAIVAAMILVGDATRPDRTPATPAAAAASASRLDGIPQRGIALGSPDAPVTVVEFADMQCPFCAQFDRDTLPGVIDRYVRTGKVRMELRLLTFVGEDSVKAARAAASAAQRNRLWQFADGFFMQQGTENSGYVTDDFLRSIDPATVGADPAAGDRAIAAAEAEAQRYGIQSTPSFVVGGTVVQADQLEAAIERELAR
ncbi:MAG: DsbA family protein [Thermoleophilia bacterium]